MFFLFSLTLKKFVLFWRVEIKKGYTRTDFVQGQRVLSSLVQIPLAFILPQNEHNKTGILLAKHPFYSRFCGILNITKDLKGFLLQGLFYVCILLFGRSQTPLKEAYRKPCVYIVSYVCCQFKHTLFFFVNYFSPRVSLYPIGTMKKNPIRVRFPYFAVCHFSSEVYWEKVSMWADESVHLEMIAIFCNIV